MKKLFIFFILFLFYFNTKIFASDVRSNHSYRNMGFTQLPNVSIGGYIDVNFNNVNNIKEDNKAIEKNKDINDIFFNSEASLLFKVNGLNNYGLKYGAIFELNANATQNNFNNDLSATKSFVYVENLFGKIEFGAEVGASKKMKIDTTKIARGSNILKGRYLNYIDLPSLGVNKPAFILIPEHPTSHNLMPSTFDQNRNFLFQEKENAIKLSYYTPEIIGFQVGFSYTPDTGNKGTSRANSGYDDQNDVYALMEYGITYTNTFYGIGVNLGYTAQKGETENRVLDVNNTFTPLNKNLNSSQYGVLLSFFGLSITASMGDWGDSLYDLTLPSTTKTSNYKTLGMAYEFSAFNFSYSYFNSFYQENNFKANSFAIDYKVARGFLPYLEYTFFTFNPLDKNVPKKDGTIISGGFIVNF